MRGQESENKIVKTLIIEIKLEIRKQIIITFFFWILDTQKKIKIPYENDSRNFNSKNISRHKKICL